MAFVEETKNIPVWLIKALEKEWSTDVWLRPIHTILRDKKELWAQIKKRFPPNAIQATIDMEGSFDNRSRIYYQIGSIFVRIKPSIKRIYDVLKIN